MQSKPYDVVLLPKKDLVERAISTSEDLKNRGVHFTLGYTQHFPHLSLYMLQLDDSDLEKVCELLETIANKTKAITVTAKEYHYENDYLDVEYEKPENLTRLQENIIQVLNPVRDGLRENDKIRLVHTIGEERENILTYGYRSVGNLFAPHLTFTRFKENQEQVISTLPSKELFDGEFVSLGIFEMGDNGTCSKELKTWNLG